MQMAKIFKPIRWSHAARSEAETLSPLPAEDDADRVSRVGAQPVTNTSPSGSSDAFLAAPEAGRADDDEETWLAMLELVFETTGWPDAEDESF
jgi:hypothetical protein